MFKQKNVYHAYISEGKKTYYVPSTKMKFFNSKDKRDGKEQARDYCLKYLINVDTIIQFDSKLECERYEYLKEIENQNKIQNLEVHRELLVQDKFINQNGDNIPAITYKADFVYYENGNLIVEDVKGASLLMDTRFEIMKQLFDKVFQNRTYIRIILLRNGKWVEWKFGDNKKSSVSNKQARLERVALKKNEHDKIVENNKIERLKARRCEIMALSKPSTYEKKRLEEINNILKEKGYIL